MTHKIVVFASLVALIASLCYVCYEWGASRAEVKVITRRMEVIKYVDKERADIYSKPNASAAAIIMLMRENKF